MASAQVDPAVDPRPTVAVAQSDWKLALIRLIEAVVWPVAFVLVALIFRVPLTAFITALAKSIGH